MTFAHGHERALPDAAPRTTDFAAPLTFNPGDTMRHAFLFFALLTFADTVARTLIAPAQLPVGVLTAVVGVPLFLWLLRRSDR